jgi:hypothetical protein
VIKTWVPWVQSAILLKEWDEIYDARQSTSVSQSEYDRRVGVIVSDLEKVLKGRAQTLLICQSHDGNALFGAFVKPAWLTRKGTEDDLCTILTPLIRAEPDYSRSESFVFTLKNTSGTEPGKFKVSSSVQMLCELDRIEGAGTSRSSFLLGTMVGLVIGPLALAELGDIDKEVGRVYEGGSRANLALWSGNGRTFGVGRFEIWQLA